MAQIALASTGGQDSLAERSKAVAQGAIPKGRGFKPHSCHLGFAWRLHRYKQNYVYTSVYVFVRFCFVVYVYVLLCLILFVYVWLCVSFLDAVEWM